QQHHQQQQQQQQQQPAMQQGMNHQAGLIRNSGSPMQNVASQGPVQDYGRPMSRAQHGQSGSGQFQVMHMDVDSQGPQPSQQQQAQTIPQRGQASGGNKGLQQTLAANKAVGSHMEEKRV